MPPLLTIRDLAIRYRGPSLFEDLECRIEPGERIGLLGRNGAGKSTFLKILTGEVAPDRGEVTYAQGAKVAMLRQDVPAGTHGTIEQIVEQGLPEVEPEEHWRNAEKVAQTLDRMSLDPQREFSLLSAGMKRRVLLAQALVASPDLLLLDEPTNHLDLDSIQWLEDTLARWRGAYLFVTHDRAFLRKLAARILEIDRGRLFDWTCDYETFLARKEDYLAGEEKQNALFDRKLAEEEVWIRTGIKARRTRNEGRVRALEAMRSERAERRAHPGKVQLDIQEAQRSGRLVAKLENVDFSYGDRTIVKSFSAAVMRGDKIGIIGPNGAGKTTLLGLILGRLEPQAGSVKLGTNLGIAYFDQLRDQLREDVSVADNVADGNSTVALAEGSRHVIGYLQDFLFTPERSRSPVRFLSGGERNRLLLAKLFAKPANVIVLDEPTNDLDSETLELLEERLVGFGGTILLVSHDREFLNHVATSTFVFEDGSVREYVGGYDDWIRQRRSAAVASSSRSKEPVKSASASGVATSGNSMKAKLSFKQKQELERLPAEIERLEISIAARHATLADPAFFRQAGERIAAEQTALRTEEETLQAAYARWEELDALAGNR